MTSTSIFDRLIRYINCFESRDEKYNSNSYSQERKKFVQNKNGLEIESELNAINNYQDNDPNKSFFEIYYIDDVSNKNLIVEDKINKNDNNIDNIPKEEILDMSKDDIYISKVNGSEFRMFLQKVNPDEYKEENELKILIKDIYIREEEKEKIIFVSYNY